MSGSSNSRALQSQPLFANLACLCDPPAPSAPGGGVIAADCSGLAIARLAARKGRSSALAQRARERFGIEVPQGPRRVEANGLAFVGVGVETWLVLSEAGFNSGAGCNADGFAASLRQAVDDVATVSDQIGSYAILRLTGPRVRDALAKFVPLDLHERVFDPGSAAATMGSHIPLTLWRLDDAAGGLPVFEVAAPRSYAASFWHILTQSSAEFGFVLAAAAG